MDFAKHVSRCLAALGLVGGLTASTASADIFLLEGDGQVRGELVNRDQSPRTTYVIKTASGGEITLDAAQVKEVKRQTAAELKYEQIRGKAPDTVDGQWKLAEWCRESRLPKQRADAPGARNRVGSQPCRLRGTHSATARSTAAGRLKTRR